MNAKSNLHVALAVLAVAFFIFLIPFSLSEIETEFNDSTTSKNIGQSGTWSEIIYVQLAKDSTIDNAILNISAVFSGNTGDDFSAFETINVSAAFKNWEGVGIAIDSKSTPHAVSCTDDSSGTGFLNYYKRESGQWTTENIKNSVQFMGFCDIEIDLDDEPQVVFSDKGGFDRARYANRSGGTWSQISIPGQLFGDVDFARMSIDTNGNLGVITGTTAIDYYFLNLTNNTWGARENAANASTSGASVSDISSGPDNVPHISYRVTVDPDPAYAVRSGGTWSSETLESDAGKDHFQTSIDIDSNNAPHIIIEDGTNDELRYFNKTSGSWTDFTIDSYSDEISVVLDENDIKIDSSDNPIVVVSKRNSTTKNIHYYYYFDGSWNEQIIYTESTSSLVQPVELYVDSNDVSHVVYSNGTNLQYSTNGLYPKNVTIDFGDDGDIEFNASNEFSTINTTSDFSSEVNDFLSTCTANPQGFCDFPINVSGVDGSVTINEMNITFTEFPRVNITEPTNGTNYDSTRTEINFTVFDKNLDSCWYTQDGGTTNITIPNCNNVTGLDSGDGDFTWTVYANDTDNNINSSTVMFTVALTAPVVNLDFPANNTFFDTNENIYLNYTATDANGLANCSVYHDLTGTFELNSTNSGVASAQQNFSIVNASSDGEYNWNVECTDTTNARAFNNTNFTFTTDTTLPLINTIQITTVAGSQNVDFNVTSFTEINCNNSFYSVFDSTGSIEAGLENISLTSCDELNASFTVGEAPPADFNLTVFMRDKSGNENSTTQQFSIEQEIVSVPGGGGGGSGGVVEQIPFIGLQPANTSKIYDDLARGVIYAVINNHCSQKISFEPLAVEDLSEQCVLSQLDIEPLTQRISEFALDVPEEDLILFISNYQDRLFFQGATSQQNILEFELFVSNLGLTVLLQVNPPSLDFPVAIYEPEGQQREIPFTLTSNKPIKTCEIISETQGLDCEIESENIIKVKYSLDNTEFISRIFSGTLLVTTDAPSDELEQRRIPVAFRVINFGWQNFAILTGVGLAVIIIATISIRNGRKKPLKQFRDFIDVT